MMELLASPWPWYVAGPLIGLIVPALLVIGGKMFGISANLRTACAIVAPGKVEFFKFDWKRAGGWNLAFSLGILIGGFLAATLLANPDPIAISAATKADLAAFGIEDFSGLVPSELFSWENVLTLKGFLLLGVGGFLVGFGAAYAGGVHLWACHHGTGGSSASVTGRGTGLFRGRADHDALPASADSVR